MAAYQRLDDLREKAEEAKCVVVEPGPFDIFVDLDSPQDQYVMEALLAVLDRNNFPVELVEIKRSRNGNKHAYLRAPRALSEIERILLQACLGSDRKRELLSFLRWKEGIEPASVFFEVKA